MNKFILPFTFTSAVTFSGVLSFDTWICFSEGTTGSTEVNWLFLVICGCLIFSFDLEGLFAGYRILG